MSPVFEGHTPHQLTCLGSPNCFAVMRYIHSSRVSFHGLPQSEAPWGDPRPKSGAIGGPDPQILKRVPWHPFEDISPISLKVSKAGVIRSALKSSKGGFDAASISQKPRAADDGMRQLVLGSASSALHDWVLLSKN